MGIDILLPLSKMLGKEVVKAKHTMIQLHGGTVGNVYLLEGVAETAGGGQEPFKIVWKESGKWERYGDHESWHREYDLYVSELDSVFTDTLRWPKCYHTEFSNDKIHLWLEYIEGVSANELTCVMLIKASLELGRLQGRLCSQKPVVLKTLTNLSNVDAIKNFYHHYRSWNVVYDYVRSDKNDLPKHLCQMIIDSDEKSNQTHAGIEKLPVVFCHRDFWVTNIFYTDEGIRLIDWDSTGWGYLGEDMVSLIADEADVDHMTEYYHKCIPAYLSGFSEYVDISHIKNHYISERLILHFGYRLVEWFLDAKTPEEKEYHKQTLQKLFEIINAERESKCQ